MPAKKTIDSGGPGLSWTTILVVLNLIALNLISLEHFTRCDFTEDALYTLSPDTRRVLNSLEDTLTVKVFMSDDLPPGFDTIRRDIKDALQEFQVAADERLNVIYLNPAESNPEVISEANGYGIPKVALSARQAERQESMMGYMGLAVLYGGRFEAIPALHVVGSIEYELLMRIARVTRPEPIKVAFYELPVPDESTPPEVAANMRSRLPRKGQRSIGSDLADAAQLLAPYYDVSTASLDQPVPEGVRTLVLANTNLDPLAMYYVDQFLMRGGNLVVFLDGIRVDAEDYSCQPARGRLDEWLAGYGIVVNKNLIYDDQNCVDFPFAAEASGQAFMRVMPYAPFINVPARFFNREHPVTASLSGDLQMLYASSLDMTPPEGCEATILLESSPRSWVRNENMAIHPEKIEPPASAERAKYAVSGLVEGSFPSYYASRPVPEDVLALVRSKKKQAERTINIGDFMSRGGSVDSPTSVRPQPSEEPPGRAESEEEPADPAGDLIMQSEKAGICLVACDNFLQLIAGQNMPRETQETMIAGYFAARQFFANAVDYLSVGGGFGNLRAREVIPRRIDPEFAERPRTESFMKVAGTVGSAAVVVVAGLIFYFVRRSFQKKEVVL